MLLSGIAMSSQLEYRSYALRATGGADRLVRGVAIRYESWQKVADKGTKAYAGSSRLREKIATGAIRLEDIPKIKALVNHRDTKYLGSTDSNLKLDNRDNTLRFELTIPRTSLGDDVLGILEAEQQMPVSIGFLSRGLKSNIKIIDLANDDELEKSLNDSGAAKTVTPVDTTEINTQAGRLDGSDYVEGRNPRTGRSWRVYKSLDIREISILYGLDPAWSGVYVRQDDLGDSSARSKAYAELELLCLGG